MASASTKLFRRLSSLRRPSSSSQHFVVVEDLRQAVNDELVADVLDEFYLPQHRRAAAVQTIISRGLIVFSILIWIRQEHLISCFVEHDELDARLPMEASQVSRVSDEVAERFWTEVQWEFLPYTFRAASDHRIIHDKVILPFLEETRLAEGASGEIFKSVIAKGQQSLFSEKVF